MSSPATVTRRRPLIWWGAGLLAVALLGGLVAVIGIVANVGGTLVATLGADPRPTPLSMTVQLETGPYVVYELTGGNGSADPFTLDRGRGLTVRPDDVRVVSESGAPVPVGLSSYTETITLGSQTYTGAVRFDIVQDGWYEIDVRTPDTQVVVAPSLVDGFRGVLPWLALGGMSALTFLVGAVLLIVGLVKGRSPRHVVRPAGWYADPQKVSAWRWWDGTAWTDRTG